MEIYPKPYCSDEQKLRLRLVAMILRKEQPGSPKFTQMLIREAQTNPLLALAKNLDDFVKKDLGLEPDQATELLKELQAKINPPSPDLKVSEPVPDCDKEQITCLNATDSLQLASVKNPTTCPEAPGDAGAAQPQNGPPKPESALKDVTDPHGASSAVYPHGGAPSDLGHIPQTFTKTPSTKDIEFRKQYALSPVGKKRFLANLKIIQESPKTSPEYIVALHNVSGGDYLAVSRHFDEFVARFVGGSAQAVREFLQKPETRSVIQNCSPLEPKRPPLPIVAKPEGIPSQSQAAETELVAVQPRENPAEIQNTTNATEDPSDRPEDPRMSNDSKDKAAVKTEFGAASSEPEAATPSCNLPPIAPGAVQEKFPERLSGTAAITPPENDRSPSPGGPPELREVRPNQDLPEPESAPKGMTTPLEQLKDLTRMPIVSKATAADKKERKSKVQPEVATPLCGPAQILPCSAPDVFAECEAATASIVLPEEIPAPSPAIPVQGEVQPREKPSEPPISADSPAATPGNGNGAIPMPGASRIIAPFKNGRNRPESKAAVAPPPSSPSPTLLGSAQEEFARDEAMIVSGMSSQSDTRRSAVAAIEPGEDKPMEKASRSRISPNGPSAPAEKSKGPAPEPIGSKNGTTIKTGRKQPGSKARNAIPTHGFSAGEVDAMTKELAETEAIMKSGLQGGFAVGAQLRKIRDRQLYKLQYKTIEAYARSQWDYSRTRVYELIDAAQFLDELFARADITRPSQVAQVKPLMGLKTEEKLQAWRRAVGMAEAAGSPITRKLVKEAAAPFKPAKETKEAKSESSQSPAASPTQILWSKLKEELKAKNWEGATQITAELDHLGIPHFTRALSFSPESSIEAATKLEKK